jgi:hypothetical protein
MEKPTKKWFTITKLDIGREYVNPDYADWADEQIGKLKQVILTNEILRAQNKEFDREKIENIYKILDDILAICPIEVNARLSNEILNVIDLDILTQEMIRLVQRINPMANWKYINGQAVRG